MQIGAEQTIVENKWLSAATSASRKHPTSKNPSPKRH